MSTVYLETERLRLRELTTDDVENLYQLDLDPEVTRYTHGGLPTPRRTVEEQVIPKLLAYYDAFDHYGFWAVEEKTGEETGRFIGWFHFRPFIDALDEIELGYRFRRDAWGKGYATEGSLALVNQGFEVLGVETVVAVAMPENRASIRVMEKIGMAFEKSYRLEDEGIDVVKYRLERGDWGYV
ncbi:MAG: GNAT family N-acetyltransferase [Planctomycetota bacterium]